MKKGTKKYYKAWAELALNRLYDLENALKNKEYWLVYAIDIADCLTDIINDEDEMIDNVEHEVKR